jgi:glycosyltransferase involved in cell wall biosynthesis
MRVLHVDAGREWRGGQNQVRLLLRELAQEPEINVRLVSNRTGELARRLAPTVPFIGASWSIGLDPRAWRMIRRTVRTFRPDLIHAHDSHALTLCRWVRTTIPLIAHRRVDFHVRSGSAWFSADHIVAVSEAVKRVLLADGVPSAIVTVIPDGIDPAEIHANAARPIDIRGRLSLPAHTPLAVNAAALVAHKDQITLIRAAAAARALAPNLHWAIAGEGERRAALAAEIARAGVGDRVHLLGYITEIDSLIREADVFVMSSREEGLGSVILHALALGKPVVSTAAGGIPEILGADALVPIADPTALAQKVVHMVVHPVATSLPDRLTAKSMARATLGLYERIFSTNPRQPPQPPTASY